MFKFSAGRLKEYYPWIISHTFKRVKNEVDLCWMGQDRWEYIIR